MEIIRNINSNKLIIRNLLIDLLETAYIFYMLVFFKTKIEFHHPVEIWLQNNNNNNYTNSGSNNLLSHTISNGIYDNKICGLGHLVAFGLVVWILTRRYLINWGYQQQTVSIINYLIWISILNNCFYF